jgi:nicotinamide mononucleotide transporter
MPDILSVNTVMLNIGGYAMSWIEFAGTVLYFASTILIARKNILNWPVGIVSVILYGILFYQIGLYSDMIEQSYYLVISVWGWFNWTRRKREDKEIRSLWTPLPRLILWLLAGAVLSTGLGFCTARFHLWFPSWFAQPASFPFVDAFTTVFSFIAMFLMTRRRNESWIYWFVIDAVGIWLYWVKGVRFISMQYVLLLGMAVYGFLFWVKPVRKSV